MPGFNSATLDERQYAKELKSKARMSEREMCELHRLLGKYEENRFRRYQAGLAEKVSAIRELVGEDVQALSKQGLSEADRRRILQE